ncbi:MAG: cadherin-like beta sandwich domain-containing protein [Gammaproteobacteria bacterium]|nr:cadherin-like beta sandwich domain-containing protein [Gammaproteobacteria bacterium]
MKAHALFAPLILLLMSACNDGSSSRASDGGDDGSSPPAASADAALQSLSIAGASLETAFAPDTTSYDATAPHEASEVEIVAQARDSAATVSIQGGPAATGSQSRTLPFSEASLTIEVVVTAENGSDTLTYRVTINRAASSDAALDSLDLGEASLDTAFDPDTTDYSASAPNSSQEIVVTATGRDDAASIAINGGADTTGSATRTLPFSGDTLSVEILVTAENGTDSRTYTVTLTRAAPQMATLDLIVLDHQGFAIEGVTIELDASPAATTDGDGRATLDVATGANFVVRASRSGYASHLQRVTLDAGSVGGQLLLGLRRLEDAEILADAANGGTVTGRDGVSLTVPPGALVFTDSGSPVVGQVEVFMSPVDVTDEREVRAFPGMFAGVDDMGNDTLILSFGAADFRFEQNGAEVQLAAGQTADIRIPVYPENAPDGTPLSAGEAIGVWFLDETTGVWQQEGSGTLVADARSPSGLVFEAEVSHFSWWNCDQPWPGATLNITVSCDTPGTPCTPPLPRITATVQSATPSNPRFVGQLQLRADEITEVGVAAGFPINLSATGGDGAFTADISPASPFTVLADMAQDVEIVLTPLHEGDGVFVPGARLRGELIEVGDTHEYFFDSKGDERFSMATYAAENVRSALGRTGELGGRVTLLDPAGTELATAVFDAFQVAEIDHPLAEAGRYTLRIIAEGKVPGWYVAGTALGPVTQTTSYLKSTSGRRLGTILAADGDVVASPANPVFQSPTIWDRVEVFEDDLVRGWRQVVTLQEDVGLANTRFGEGLDIDADTMVVGAPGEDRGRGAVYIFRREVGDTVQWVREDRITAPNVDAGDNFGTRVAVSGNTLVVGAPGEDGGIGGIGGDGADNGTRDAGAAYVYFRNAQNEWVFDTLIKPDTPRAGGEFGGLGLDLDGDTLVVSSSRGFDTEEGLHVFERTGVAWSQADEFFRSEVGFAEAIAVAGDRFVVGSRNVASRQGRVYVYTRAGDVWGETATLSAPNADDLDLFGASVAFDGTTIAVGAPWEAARDTSDPADNSLPRGGAVYLFEQDGAGVWRDVGYLKPDVLDSRDEFGWSVGLGAGFVGAGAPFEDGIFGDPNRNDREESGAVYVIPR